MWSVKTICTLYHKFLVHGLKSIMAFPKDLIHLFFNPMAQYCYSIRINNTTISTNIIPINISGDFYVTKHSNLSDIHVVFHMVTDESVYNGNINSRHPVVMGLRNVLKVASMSSISTVTGQ